MRYWLRFGLGFGAILAIFVPTLLVMQILGRYVRENFSPIAELPFLLLQAGLSFALVFESLRFVDHYESRQEGS